MPNSRTIEFLSQLRFSVLTMGEQSPDTCWNSSVFSKSGQSDLAMVFPRTATSAAISHTSALAKQHHDDRTRATGVYHLFRLPTDIEGTLHKATIEKEQAGDFNAEFDSLVWKEISAAPPKQVTPQEGPVDLGELDLQKRSDLLLLGHTYKAAFDANLSCIPYFRLNQ